MGCGSLSTTAVHSNHGASLHARDQNMLRAKNKPNMFIFEDNRISPRNTLSVGYSPLVMSQLKPESNSKTPRKEKADHLSSKGGPTNNFQISVKDVDEEKYKHEDGGVWLGVDPITMADKRDLEPSQVSITEHIRNKAADSANLVNVNAEYATISLESHGTASTTLRETISNEKEIRNDTSKVFLNNKFKKERFSHQNRLQFESIEDGFSNNYEHYEDEDKQMSDSELDDRVNYVIPRSKSENALNFKEHINGIDQNTEIVGNEELSSSSDSYQLPESRSQQAGNFPAETLSSNISEGKKVQEVENKFQTKFKTPTTSSNGLSLEDFQTCADNPYIPDFVFKCVRYIEEVGLNTEGLYRISGNKAQGELFLEAYLTDPKVDFAALEVPVTVIATLLKSFLNDLREALIPSRFYEELTVAAEVENKSSQLEALSDVINKMPPLNFEVLKFIIAHLSKVAQHQECNNMTSSNLAKCWWPTVIRVQFKTYEDLVQGSKVPEDIVQMLIEHFGFVFNGESVV